MGDFIIRRAALPDEYFKVDTQVQSQKTGTDRFDLAIRL